MAIVSAGCTSSIAAPTNYAPFSQTDLVSGAGEEAVSGRTLTVAYAGWVYDASRTDQKGVQFDASGADAPFSFTLGNGDVIPGWELGLPGIRVGGTRRLVIPAPMAYGSFRRGSIPPNATLVFDVELLSVQ